MVEKIWERIGFTLVGAITGFIYALTVAVVFFPFIQSLDVFVIFKVFVIVFGVVGIFAGDKIISSALGAVYSIYVLYGYVLGFLSASGAPVINESILPNKSSAILFVIFGILSGVLCVLLIYL